MVFVRAIKLKKIMKFIYHVITLGLFYSGSFLHASDHCLEMMEELLSHQRREEILKTLPNDSAFLMNHNRTLAMEIIAPGGPLESYLLRQKVDLKTVTIHLFGSSASGRSFNPLKDNRLISDHSDIDLWVDAKLVDGTPWMLPSGPNKAFKFKDKSVEVISSWDKGGLDIDLFNQMGIEVYEEAQKKKRYENSILLKSPTVDFLKIAKEAKIFKELDPYMISSFLASNGRIATVSNETIIRQNEILEDLYVVLKADQIEIIVDTEQEKNISLMKDHLQSGVFGEKSAILGGETEASVYIKGEGLIYRVSKDKLDQLKKDYPQFEISILKYFEGQNYLNKKN